MRPSWRLAFQAFHQAGNLDSLMETAAGSASLVAALEHQQGSCYRGPDVSDEKPFHNPFDALRALRDALPEAPAAAPPRPDPPTAAAPSGVARAVVRLERTGRGGKEVTVIDKLGLGPRQRDEWLKALKAALGCGGTVEDDRLVLQGDQRTRLRELLAARGVRKITVA